MNPVAPFRRILVPTDFSPPSAEAWALARRLAHAVNAELVLAHVFVETPLYSEGVFSGDRVREVYDAGRAWVDKTLGQWAAEARAEGLTVRTVVRTGVPHRELIALAADEQVDLVIVGTRGRGGVERAVLGSVADRVVRGAPCPVLAVREIAPA